jgi:FkbM family methyltransferase
MKNGLKENIFLRGLNFAMNKLYVYPYFKLKGPLKNHTAKIVNVHYIWRAPETQVADIIEEKISKGDVVMDVGTHFGYYSLLLAKKVGSDGKVICFEPSKETRRILTGNIVKNNYQKRVKIEKNGVSDRKKVLSFSTNKFSPMNSFVRSDFVKGANIECIDLDSYCEENKVKPSFLKIDVEGVEKEVIFGMKKIIKEDKPRVLLEASKEIRGIKEIFEVFKNSGYKIYSWKTRVDEDSWKDLKEINYPEDIIARHVFFEYFKK